MATANLTAVFSEPTGLAQPVPHTVYTKTSWADEWEEAEYLYCNWASWALSPNLPTAELSWNYGRGKRFDLPTWLTILPDDGSRRYVKIEWTNSTNIIGSEAFNPVWYGIVNGMGTRQGGVRENASGTDYEAGQQVLQCVGLEKLLDDTVIRTSAWYDYDEGEIYNVDRGLTFNDHRADGTPGGNMTSIWVDGAPAFSGKVIDDDDFWKTKDIIQYLFKYHQPKDKNATSLVRFSLPSETLTFLASLDDKPYLPTDGRSIRDLLNQLLTAERLMSWRLEVSNADNSVKLIICPWNGDVILLPNNTALLPNEYRWLVDVDATRSDVVRVLSHAHAVDRVRVRGARATSTFSVSKADGTLEAGWTTTLESDYETGASGVSGYSSLTKDEKKQRNAIARTVDKLKPVFSRFRIPHDWDGVAKNGEGDGGSDFTPIVTDTPRYKYNKREFRLEKFLPLRDGYNYESLGGTDSTLPPTKVSEGPFNRLPPLVVIKVPGETRWAQIEKVGGAGTPKHGINKPNRSWSGRVRIPEKDRSIVIDVNGEAQHVIAGDDFTPLSGELPQTSSTVASLGAWDWENMICTVCAKWDAYCEGVYPQFSSVTTADVVREVVLQASDTFRLDWLVPLTVIGITNDGQLVRSSDGGWINDDRKKLEDRARLAYEWYGIERRAIQWSSCRVNGSILPGDYVVTLGSNVQNAVNSVVTEVRIDCPGAMDGTPPPPRISYTTDFVLDFDLYLDGVARSRSHVERFG